MISPERLAVHVLDSLRIRDPDDLLRLDGIAWARHHALVREASLTGSEARLTMWGNKAVITVSNTVGTYQRKRFCVAHEIGHLEMHHLGGFLHACSTGDLNSWRHGQRSPTIEELSNQFAAALLLPEKFFAGLCTGSDPSLDCVSALADRFRVSLTATAIRYATFCQEPVAIVYSEKGYIKWFHGNPDFEDLGLFINVGDCPEPETIADRIFRGLTEKPRARHVHARAWFGDKKVSKNAEVVEQSWPISQYDAVITLLWVDSELHDEDD